MVIVIVADVLAFVFRDTNKNESQEHQFFGGKIRRKIGVCVYTFLYVKKLKEYASKPIREVRNIDGENLVVLRAGHRKTIYR
jgi:hypothetical protein